MMKCRFAKVVSSPGAPRSDSPGFGVPLFPWGRDNQWSKKNNFACCRSNWSLFRSYQTREDVAQEETAWHCECPRKLVVALLIPGENIFFFLCLTFDIKVGGWFSKRSGPLRSIWDPLQLLSVRSNFSVECKQTTLRRCHEFGSSTGEQELALSPLTCVQRTTSTRCLGIRLQRQRSRFCTVTNTENSQRPNLSPQREQMWQSRSLGAAIDVWRPFLNHRFTAPQRGPSHLLVFMGLSLEDYEMETSVSLQNRNKTRRRPRTSMWYWRLMEQQKHIHVVFVHQSPETGASRQVDDGTVKLILQIWAFKNATASQCNCL